LNIGTGQGQEDVGFIINGKYFIQSDMAILGGFGLGIAGGDAKGTDIGLIIGARKYLKVADFAPFVGGRLTYASVLDSTVKLTELIAEGGAEYFLAKNFSFEGRAGFGFSSVDLGAAGKTSNIGTTTFGISFNFYF